MPRRDRDPDLAAEDARFVAWVGEHYAPAPLDRLQRAAFDARLRERIEARHGGLGWRAAPVWLAAGLALAWLWLGPLTSRKGPGPEPSSTASLAAQPAQDAWEETLFYGDAEQSVSADRAAFELPPDLRAIESLFLGS